MSRPRDAHASAEASARSAARAGAAPMRSLTVPAPAKLNLFLHVTGRRADGYHDLESLFVALDFGDTVRLTRRADGVIARTAELPGVPVAADLAIRAAHALQSETETPHGVDIAVVKRIPQGAGLGGGSSDAASVLLALNRLWDLHVPRAVLMRIGRALGADVPFFILGCPAIARGVGEQLTPVSLPPVWVSVLTPAVIVPTAVIFAAPELTRATPSAKINVFSEGYGRNDLQAAAVARFPDIAAALAALAQRSPSARMTGSGGSVFATFASEAEARAGLAAAVEAMPGTRGMVSRTLARHPLAAFA
jgi:4-diphosphocytidyl-2-C-methyl-D-erythritol kinase